MKLPFTIFYSWQTDLVAKYNRNYILDALKKAVKAIGRDNTVTLEPVVDRDTMGLPGSPSIVESITAKIAKSDLFIANVSIVSPIKNRRPMPNPNVLFELGYASAVLGWDRIILIQNTRYGGPEKLPFDLRGRRILTYEVGEAPKTMQKQQLKDNLLHTLKDALNYTQSELPAKDHPVWLGSWEQRTATNASGGHLRITRVSSDAFFFHILIFDGARSGVMQGRAMLLTPIPLLAGSKHRTMNFVRLVFSDIGSMTTGRSSSFKGTVVAISTVKVLPFQVLIYRWPSRRSVVVSWTN